jgi:F-type H+-transporting ATPase subunit gamma
MATPEELRGRITALEELRSLVRIMRAMAAVKSRSFSAAVESARLYGEVVATGMQALLRDMPPGVDPQMTGLGAGVLVCFGSDQGMCGSFNRKVAARVCELVAEGGGHAGAPRVLVVGLRLAGEIEEAGLRMDVEVHLPGSLDAVVAAGQDLVARVDALRRSEDAAWVRVVHNSPTGVMSFETVSRQLVPFDHEWLREKASRRWEGPSLPMRYGTEEDLLAELVRQHLLLSLFRAFAESIAAENAARLSAMEAATRSVEDRLEQLTRDFHGVRQSAITEELLDVIAGAEALAL